MIIKIICAECGLYMDTKEPYGRGRVLNSNGSSDGALQIEVIPCGCQQKRIEDLPITMPYGDLVAALEYQRVHVTYTKKNGAPRVLYGFLGQEHSENPNLVYFLEFTDEIAEDENEQLMKVKCLLKDNIHSIRQQSTDLVFGIERED